MTGKMKFLEIDHLVENILEDKTKTTRLKRLLYAERLKRQPPPDIKEDGDDDLWNNLPI